MYIHTLCQFDKKDKISFLRTCKKLTSHTVIYQKGNIPWMERIIVPNYCSIGFPFSSKISISIFSGLISCFGGAGVAC